MTLRVVEWSTGTVGRHAIAGIDARPELELVGVWVSDPAKVGRDAGDLADLGRDLGVQATNDRDALIALKPDAIVAAWTRGDIDGAYVWAPAKSKLLTSGGEVFKTWDKLDAAGYSIADTILVRDGFSKDQPDAVTALLKVYGQALDLYRNKPDEAAEVVAKAAGVSVDVATSDLKEYDFISLKDQLSPKWLGTPGQAGKFAEVLLHTAQFLVEQKSIIKALPLEAYQKGIDVRFLQQALS